MLRSIQSEQDKLKKVLMTLDEPIEISIIKSAYKKVEGLNTIIRNLKEENNLFLHENTLYSRKYLIAIGVEVPKQKEEEKIDINFSKVFSEQTRKELNKKIKRYEKCHIQSIETASYIRSN